MARMTNAEQGRRKDRAVPGHAGMTSAVGPPALVALGHVLGRVGTENALQMTGPEWIVDADCPPGSHRNVNTGQVWPIPDAEQ